MGEIMHSEIQERSMENKESKEKIISDAQEARRHFHDFWKKNNSPKALKKELKQNEKDRIEELIRQGDEMTALLYYGPDDEEENPEKKEFNFNKILIASGSKDKQDILSDIAEKCGLKTESDTKDRKKREIYQQTFLKRFIKNDAKQKYRGRLESYALEVAQLKATDVYNNRKNNPVIASDIVVLEGLNILEKPKSKEDAVKILSDLSGKEVSISCGVALLTQTKSGKEIMLNEGINFVINLRDFSIQEAENYIDRCGSDVLNVAGVIDYSNANAKNLIDSGIAIKVEPLKLEGYNKGIVLISSEVLPQLKDYFKGAPEELIEEILEKQRGLSKV